MADNELRRHKIRAELYDNVKDIESESISESKIKISDESAENGVFSSIRRPKSG